MPSFLHHPSQRIIESSSPQQAARYRRSHRFTELVWDDSKWTDPESDTDSHYHSPNSLPDSSSSPQSPPDPQPTKPSPLESDRPNPPESHEIHTIAPHATEPPFDDLTTTDVSNLTVQQVLDIVANNPERAQQALDAETQGRNRVTLTSKLRRIR